jgi:hypothetical protein
MVEKVAGLFEAQVIVHNGSEILNRVAGVWEKEPLHPIAVTLKDKFQTQSHHRADVRLKVGTGVADL